jgi:arylsulfatase
VKESPRKEFLYWSVDGALMARRYDQGKLAFLEPRRQGCKVWQEPFVNVRLPLPFNLRSDPVEKAPLEASSYDDGRLRRLFLLVAAQADVAKGLSSFQAFPPRQKPARFRVEEVMQKLAEGPRGR